MALIAPQVVSIAALTAVYSTPTTSDTIAPDNGLVLHVKNTNGASRTVTLVRPGTSFGVADADLPYVVPADTGDVFIPVPNHPSFINGSGLIGVTFSATAGVTAALLKFSTAS